MSKYGHCECGGAMYPIWFEEEEYKPNSNTTTGRVKTACSHLVCAVCLYEATVDDSFDRPWRDK